MTIPVVSASLVKTAFAAALSCGLSREALLSAVAVHSAALSAADCTLLAGLLGSGDECPPHRPPPNRFADQVRAVLSRQLEEGRYGIGTVARALAVSARTLQRRLEGEGTTFAALCDEIRRDAALAFLRAPGIAIKEAAFRVGFSEPSTFYRAFRRWTGATPADYRRSLLN